MFFSTIHLFLGFRSRAAFKLIQLNRKFGFLQKSLVCVDLCAAPGGWMQVAKQNMPVSSIVIGIDLFPIKPVPGCIGLTEDITTEKCKQALTKELKTWKVDVMLNDGAPNVGRNWLFDAYQQICLSLSAVKLSTEFLRPGGWFVTKVFRSKDYNAFIWVLKQLFKKVYATKPSASRKESAEIFIVCQGYKAPSKIDPRFLDPKFVFEELEIEPKNKIDILKEPKTIKKPKAVGYESIDLRRIYTATEFLKAETALDVLTAATEIRFDDKRIENHAGTTDEIKECFKDIKVCGRKDLKEIIRWWKALKEEFYPVVVEAEAVVEAKILTPEEQEEAELQEMEKYLKDLKEEEQREDKRKKKRSNKDRSKLEQKLALKMVIKGDAGPQETIDGDIFNLREIKSKKVLAKLIDEAPGLEGKRKEKKQTPMQKMVAYDDDDLHDDEAHFPTLSDDDGEVSEEEIGEALGIESDDDNSDSEEEDEEATKKEQDDRDDWDLRKDSKGKKKSKEAMEIERNRNPLITDLDYRDKDSKRVQKAELWFEKDAFKDLKKQDEKEEDLDLDNMVKNYKKKGITVTGEQQEKVPIDLSVLGKKARRRARHDVPKDAESSDDSDSGDEHSEPEEDEEEDFQVVPRQKKIKLNEEELALGQLMVSSKRVKRDLIDGAWNRWMFSDTNLPDWFVEDENKAMKRDIPVPSEMITDYRSSVAEFNTRSIKKVMEAKARKKRQSTKQMEKIKKKAENILDNAEQSGQEKIKMLKK